MRISDWSSDVCSSDLLQVAALLVFVAIIMGESSPLVLVAVLLIYPLFVCAISLSLLAQLPIVRALWGDVFFKIFLVGLQLIFLYFGKGIAAYRSEEHTSELQSLMRISYAVFCLKKKIKITTQSSNVIDIIDI